MNKVTERAKKGEKRPSLVLSQGDIFKDKGHCYHIVARTSTFVYDLIRLSDGNRYFGIPGVDVGAGSTSTRGMIGLGVLMEDRGGFIKIITPITIERDYDK